MSQAKPSDFMITLAAAIYGADRFCADEIRGQLSAFGFECSTQQVAAWLGRIGRKDLPPIEADPEYPFGGVTAYKLTQWGWTELWNRGLKDCGMSISWPVARGRR